MRKFAVPIIDSPYAYKLIKKERYMRRAIAVVSYDDALLRSAGENSFKLRLYDAEIIAYYIRDDSHDVYEGYVPESEIRLLFKKFDALVVDEYAFSGNFKTAEEALRELVDLYNKERTSKEDKRYSHITEQEAVEKIKSAFAGDPRIAEFVISTTLPKMLDERGVRISALKIAIKYAHAAYAASKMSPKDEKEDKE